MDVNGRMFEGLSCDDDGESVAVPHPLCHSRFLSLGGGGMVCMLRFHRGVCGVRVGEWGWVTSYGIPTDWGK